MSKATIISPNIISVLDRDDMITMLEQFLETLRTDDDHAVVALELYPDSYIVRAFTEQEWNAVKRQGKKLQ